jgi:hypothetical protein
MNWQPAWLIAWSGSCAEKDSTHVYPDIPGSNFSLVTSGVPV